MVLHPPFNLETPLVCSSTKMSFLVHRLVVDKGHSQATLSLSSQISRSPHGSLNLCALEQILQMWKMMTVDSQKRWGGVWTSTSLGEKYSQPNPIAQKSIRLPLLITPFVASEASDIAIVLAEISHQDISVVPLVILFQKPHISEVVTREVEEYHQQEGHEPISMEVSLKRALQRRKNLSQLQVKSKTLL